MKPLLTFKNLALRARWLMLPESVCVCGLLLIAAQATAQVGGSPFYEFKIVASRGTPVIGALNSSILTDIHPHVSVNDQGRIAFYGRVRDPHNVGPGGEPLHSEAIMVIEPGSDIPSHVNSLSFRADPSVFLDSTDVQINNDNKIVVARNTQVWLYDAGIPGGLGTDPDGVIGRIAYIYNVPGENLALGSYRPSLSDDGLVAHVVMDDPNQLSPGAPDRYWLSIRTPIPITDPLGIIFLPDLSSLSPLSGPSAASDIPKVPLVPATGSGGVTVMRDSHTEQGNLMLFEGTGERKTLASTGSGWQALASSPGISADGRIVVFVARDAQGFEGLHLYVNDPQVNPLGITTPLLDSQTPISFAEDASPIRLNYFDFNNRIAVVHHDLGSDGNLVGDSVVVAFVAKPERASVMNPAINPDSPTTPLLFSAKFGIWTARVDIQTGVNDTTRNFANVSSILPVIQEGAKVDGATVTNFFLWSGLGRATRQLDGSARWTQDADNPALTNNPAPGDHLLAFRVETTGGPMLLLAGRLDSDEDGLPDHWERTDGGIDMDGDGEIDLDLPRFGANPFRKDLFLEVDWLEPRSTDSYPGGWKNEPHTGALTNLVGMFALAPLTNVDGSTGIQLHVDAGKGNAAPDHPFSVNVGQATPAMLQGGDTVRGKDPNGTFRRPDVIRMGNPLSHLRPILPMVTQFSDVKSLYFGTTDKRAREIAFRYCILSDFIDAIERDETNQLDLVCSGALGNSLDVTNQYSSSFTDNYVRGSNWVMVTSGAGAGQVRKIVFIAPTEQGFTFLVEPFWRVKPAPGDKFAILTTSSGISEATHIEDSFWWVRSDGTPLEEVLNGQSWPGNDLLTTLGPRGVGDHRRLGNMAILWRTIAHELGHTLGLKHGGINRCRYRGDRHLSLMSYTHQLRLDPMQDLRLSINDCDVPIENRPVTNFFPGGQIVGSYSDGTDPLGFNEWAFLKMSPHASIWHLGNTALKFRGSVFNPHEDDHLMPLDSQPLDVNAPAVSIQSPLVGSLVPIGDHLTVSVIAQDHSEIVSVRFSFDSDGNGSLEVTNLPTAGNGLYHGVFSSVSGSPGTRSLRIEVSDVAGNQTVLSPNIAVGIPVPDSSAPSIQLGKPQFTGTPVVQRSGDWLEVEVRVYDFDLNTFETVPVDHVTISFDVDGDGTTNGPGEMIVLAQFIESPLPLGEPFPVYHVLFPAISGPPGQRPLRIVATDKWLNPTVTTVPIQVALEDTTAPTIVFLTPAEGTNLPPGAVLTVEVTAQDNEAIGEILALFDVNGDGTDEGINLSLVSNGRYQGRFFSDSIFGIGVVGPAGTRVLTVTAKDPSGNTTSVTRSVVVLPSPPPTIYILSPTENAVLRTNSTLTVEVDAGQAGGIASMIVSFDSNGNGQTSDPGETVAAVPVSIFANNRKYRAFLPQVSGPAGTRVITAVATNTSSETGFATSRVIVTHSVVIHDPTPGQQVPQGSTFMVHFSLASDAEAANTTVRFDTNGDGDTDDPGEAMTPATFFGRGGWASFSNIRGPIGERFVQVQFQTPGAEGILSSRPVLVTDGGSIEGHVSTKLAAVPFVPEATPNTYQYGSGPQDMVVAGDQMFFRALQQLSGRELWRTDGTRRGTYLVRDIWPGPASGPQVISAQYSHLPFDSKLFFIGSDGDWITSAYGGFGTQYGGFGSELWESDGTAAGTRLLKDIKPRGRTIHIQNGASDSSWPSDFVVFKERVFFTATDGVFNQDGSLHGEELWCSDGTTEGTTLCLETTPGTSGDLYGLRVVQDTLFFFRFSQSQSSWSNWLWRSDGTPAGTIPVKEIISNIDGGVLNDTITSGAGLLFFATRVGQMSPPTGIWRSDGTPAGTFIVQSFPFFNPLEIPLRMKGFPEGIYLSANDGVHGFELWKSDGTAPGTVLVKDIAPGPTHSVPIDFIAFDDAVYFSANDGVHGRELWRTDGTDAGTHMVINLAKGEKLPVAIPPPSYPTIHSSPESLTVFNGHLYFSANSGEGVIGRELWRTDGTAEGTELVRDLAPGMTLPDPFPQSYRITDPASSSPSNLHVFENRLYFSAWDQLYRHELWTSDGSAAGTFRLRNLHQPPGGPIAVLQNAVVFPAQDLVSGKEIWATTASGTAMLTNVAPGLTGSNPRLIATLAGQVFFSAEPGFATDLWRTDGTPERTFLLGNFHEIRETWSLGDTLLFVARDDESGSELWRTDGTQAGTFRLKDINPGPADSWPTGYPRAFCNYQGAAYFAASNQLNGVELWRTDGTPTGTEIVQDILPGPASSNPRDFLESSQGLLFWANDGVHGYEPWLMPVTGPAQLLKDINPGSADSAYVNWQNIGFTPVPRIAINDVIFFQASDGVHGLELWRSDGTAVGTSMVKAMGATANGSKPYQLVALQGTLYFTTAGASSTDGLWRSDGTADGTTLIIPGIPTDPPWIVTGPGVYIPPSIPQKLQTFGDLIYFFADGNRGRELWRSDGSSNGTFIVKDIMPGHGSSDIAELVPLGDKLYFAATDPEHGRELWYTDGTLAGTQLVEDLLPGPESANPSSLTVANGFLYYFANDGSDDVSLRRVSSGRPILSITVSGSLAVISWQESAGYFELEETGSLQPPIQWTPSPWPYTTNAAEIRAIVPATGSKFYRLRK